LPYLGGIHIGEGCPCPGGVANCPKKKVHGERGGKRNQTIQGEEKKPCLWGKGVWNFGERVSHLRKMQTPKRPIKNGKKT